MTLSSELAALSRALKKQRKRLRSDWSQDQFENWRAYTVTVMSSVEFLHRLTRRLEDVITGECQPQNKVKQARELLTRAIDALHTLPAIDALQTPPAAGVPTLQSTGQGGTNIHLHFTDMLSVVNEQKLVQKLQVGWPMVESRVDEDAGILSEYKEEAKGHAKTIWEGFVNKSRDTAAIGAAINMFAQLGGDLPKLLSLFG